MLTRMYVLECDMNRQERQADITQALEKYWTFVRRVTESLSKPGVQKFLGPAYKPLFDASLRFFEVSADRHRSKDTT